MINKKLGLVLSGGGVKGFGHIGLLKALEEENIYPTHVSGTSAGAMVGAFYCAGYRADEINKIMRSQSLFDLTKLTIRKPGILDTSKFKNMFEGHIKEDSFEHLQRKLVVVSTNMQTGKAALHSKGTLFNKVLASASFPGVFAPVIIDGEAHMDGGIVCNFPTETFESEDFPCFGSYACYTGPKTRRELSNSLKIMVRSSQLMLWGMSEPKFKKLKYVFCPEDMYEIGFFDTRKQEEAIAIGYKDAVRNMDAFKKALEPKFTS